MSDTPPPASDDPYEVLGVPRTADETEVRRAYVRLIRVWRPERHPEVFQRIQEAYEAVRGDRRAAPRRPAPSRTERPPEPPPAPDVAEALRTLWQHESAGDPDAADLALSKASQLGAAPGLVLQHRILLREHREGPQAAAAALLEDMARDPQHAHYAVAESLLDLPLLHEHFMAPPFAWEALEALRDRRLAIRLFTRRIDRALATGRAAEIADEMSSSVYEDAAEDDDALQYETLRVASVLAWRDPTRAEAMRQRWPAGKYIESQQWTPEDHMTRALGMSAAYRAWLDGGERSVALTRYLEAAPVLPTETVLALAEQLPSKRSLPDRAWIEEVLGLDAAVPDAGEYLCLATGLEQTPARLPRPDMEEIAIDLFRWVGKRVTRGFPLSAWHWTRWLVAGTVATIASIWMGWWALLLLLALVWGLGRAVKHLRIRRYRRHTRPMVAFAILALDMAPERAVAFLYEDPPWGAEVAVYLAEITEDWGLRALWSLQGVAEMAHQDPRRLAPRTLETPAPVASE